MLFSVEPSSPIPIYAQIVNQVRAAVAAGDLHPGDALPSVRQLATELRINPNTVAQAYRELEREGFTRGQRGQGTFVAELDPAQRASARMDVGNALVARMMEEAYRLGFTAAEIGSLLEEQLAAIHADQRAGDRSGAAG